MTDVKYKIDSLKYKFAKKAIYHADISLVAVAVLGTTVGIGGMYGILDKREDNIATAKAPQVVEEIKQDIAKLSERSQKFEYISRYVAENGKAPFSEQEITKMEVDFNNILNQVFPRILTDNSLSERQASELWELASNQVLPESIGYENSYDFGFLKEAREEVLDSNSLFTNRDKFAGAVSAELKEQDSIEAFSVLGAVGLLLILPFITSMERGRIARWAQNPPPANRRLRKKSRFKHGN